MPSDERVDRQRALQDRVLAAGLPDPDRQPDRGERARRAVSTRHEHALHEAAAEQADHQHDHRAARQREQRRQRLVVDDRGLDLAAARSVLIGSRDLLGAAAMRLRRIDCVVSFSVRCTTNCGYTPERDHDHATSGAIAARFTRVDLTRLHRRPDPAVHRALEEPDHVDGGEHHADAGHQPVDELVLEGAEQDQDLADEVAGARHRERGERRRSGTAPRAPAPGTPCRPARASDSLPPRAQRDHPDDQEQRHHHEPVVEHLEDRALGALRGRSAKIPSTMKPSCAIDEYADAPAATLSCENARTDPYRIEKTARMMNSSWKCWAPLGHDRQHDPQEAVDADLRQHAGQQRQHRDRRGAVGVRHPAVQREQRRLHEEREREQQEDPLLRAERPRVRCGGRRARTRCCRRRGVGSTPSATAAGQHQQRARPACRSRTWSWPARGRPCPSRRSGSRTAPASGRRRRRTAPGPAP